VATCRGERRTDIADPLIDAWLLRNFPGRTLDELDRMDWGRYMRAIEAAQIELIEKRRAALLSGKATELTPDEGEAILEHDRLMREYGEPD